MVDPLANGSPGEVQPQLGGGPGAIGASQEPIESEAPQPAQSVSFDQIAELLGVYGAARQVGWALRRLPLPSTVPWQRVVNAQGRISMDPSRQGSDWIQRELLLAEGIAVAADGRLPLAAHRWQPVDLVPLARPLGR